MKYIGYTTSFIVIAFISAVINGWTFSILWSWFIAGTFGLPELSIPLAIGFALTVSFLTMNSSAQLETKELVEVMLEALFTAVVKCLVSIASGWVVLQFV